MTRAKKFVLAILLSAVGMVSSAMGEVLTYQGQLKEDGVPAEGAYDLQFYLFTVESGGSPVGGLSCQEDVPVVHGLFTVELDFDEAVFNGQSLWLEVRARADAGVSCASGVFTTLTPRQPLTPVPYALRALNSADGNSLDAADGNPTNALFVDNGGDVFITGGANLTDAALRFSPGSGPLISSGLDNTVARRMWISHSDVAPLWGIQYRDLPSDGFAGESIEFLAGAAGDPRMTFRLIDGIMQIRGPHAALHVGGTLFLDGENTRVGIGVSGSAFPLHVRKASAGAATANASSSLVLENNGANYLSILTPNASEAGLLFGQPAGSAAGAIVYNNTSTANGLQFRTLSSTRMVVDADGDVGVGTTSPTHRLDLAGVARMRVNANTNFLVHGGVDDGYLDLIKESNTTPSARIEFNGVTDQATHRASLGFFTRGASDGAVVERMRITEEGDVGLGTSTPTCRLMVSGPGTDDGGVTFENEVVARFRQTNTAEHTALSIDAAANKHPLLYLAENGQAKWDLRNDAQAAADSDNAFSLRYRVGGADDAAINVWKPASAGFIMEMDGELRPEQDAAYDLGDSTKRWKDIWATNSVIQTSDARLKERITTLTYGLSTILALRPVSFTWKDALDERLHLGLVAQEVEPFVPEAVVKDGDPDHPAGIAYSALVPVLIKAVQEQQAVIAAQQARVNDLEAQVGDMKQLEDRVRDLERAMQTLPPQATSPHPAP